MATGGYYEEPAWFPDSRHWIEMTTDRKNFINGVVIHDVQNPSLIVTKKFSALAGTRVIQITPENHLRTRNPFHSTVEEAANAKPQIYWDTPLDEPLPKSRLVYIPLGAGWAHEVYHSRDGNHLLWHIGFQNRLPFQSMFAGMSESLWLSKADGSGMHELGRIRNESTWIRARKTHMGYYSDCLTDIFWLPDGKHVQFSLDEFEGREDAEKNVYTLEVN